MKYFFVTLSFLILIFSSCNAQQSPKDVARGYLKAIDKLKFEDAKKLLIPNEENLQSLENIKKFAEKMTPAQKKQYISSEKQYDLKEERLTTNSASVIATNKQGDYIVTIRFILEKTDTKWLIKKVETS